MWVFAAGDAFAQSAVWSFFDSQPQSFYYQGRAQDSSAKARREDYRPRRHHAHHPAKPVIQSSVEDDKPAHYQPPVVGSGPMGAFVNDPTLRKGDIVVTTLGVRVFQGHSADEHSTREFVALSKAHLSNSHVAELMQIEQSNRQYASRFELADTDGGATGGTVTKKSSFVVLQVHRGAKN